MIVLGGDIGGTKTWLRISTWHEPTQQATTLFEARYPSNDYADLEMLVTAFLNEAEAKLDKHPIATACFAIAGPVKAEALEQSATVTNLPWRLSSRQLEQTLSIPRVRLINDFEAIAYGVPKLTSDDIDILYEGEPQPNGNRIILGAGTGLGVCQMIWDRDHYVVVPSEGGHWDFAPLNNDHIGLLQYLWRTFSHVSYDRIVSGNGIVNIFMYLAEDRGLANNHRVEALLQSDDPAANIANNQSDFDLAKEAIDIFVYLYGAVAGNLALINHARGGIYLAGGVAPKLINNLRSENFIKGFKQKGRVSHVVENIPVQVVTNQQVGLIGAIAAATN